MSLATGDVVVAIAATAEWIRQGSETFPEEWWVSVPRGYRFAAAVPIQFFQGQLLAELMGELTVLAVSNDGERLRVKVKSGRVSVVKVEHVLLLERGGKLNAHAT